MVRQIIKLRRDTLTAFAAANPVLASGEPGYETDTGKMKIGDGVTAWNSLDYFVSSSGGSGGNSTITITAGTGGINAYQVVIVDPASGTSIPADGTNATHAGLVIGMATEPIAEDAEGDAQQTGSIENLAWDLDPGCQYFLVAGGAISKTPPSTGFWQKIGVALDSVTLILQIGEAIEIV